MRAISGRETRPEVGDDRERLERRLREPTLHGPLDEPGARLGRLPRRPEGVPAGDLLEHDAASAFAVARGEQAESSLHAFGLVLGGSGELLDGERRRRDHEQRLDRAREAVDGVFEDSQAALFHTVISSKGAACSMAISPALRSSSSARKATACSTRLSASTSLSKTKRPRRRSTARKRSRKSETGGKVSVMWRSDGAGGSAASARRAAASDSGLLGGKRPLGHGRERWRAEAEVAVGLGVELVLEPARGGAEAAVLREALGELAGRVVGVEVLEGHLFSSSGKSPRAFSSRSEATRTRNSPSTSRSPAALLQEREDDLDDLDVRELELLLEDERQQEVERPLERIEVERELATALTDSHSIVSGGRGLRHRHLRPLRRSGGLRPRRGLRPRCDQMNAAIASAKAITET